MESCAAVLMSEKTVEPLFQLLVHKVTIENFDLMRDLAKKKALPDCAEDSEEFFEHGTVIFLGSFGQPANLELQLWLCPNGDREDWDALTITISNEGTEDLPDFTKLTLLDSRDEFKEISSCETVGICRAKRGYVRFFFNWTDHNILRVGNRLVLKVEMRFLRKMIHLGTEAGKNPCAPSLPLDLFEYMEKKYLRNAKDRIYVEVAGKKILCSKALLSCRSPFFERMFLGGFKESTAESIVLEDIDAEVAVLLLGWMQTDSLPDDSELDWSTALRLLVAADRYQISRLVDCCIHHLRRILSAGNASIVDVMSVRKLLQNGNGSSSAKLAKECEAYIAARAVTDPSKVWKIFDFGAVCLSSKGI